MRNCKTQLLNGFTLSELLVTIAVVAILASLLVTTLARGTKKAWETRCLANLKQLQTSYFMYTADNAGALPVNLAFAPAGVWRSARNSWCGYSNATLPADEKNLRLGTLFPYHSTIALYKCPADRSFTEEGIGSTAEPRVRSYSLNGALHGRGADMERAIILYLHEATNPSQTFTFIGESETTIDDGHFFTASNVPSIRHSPATPLVFLDGHVSTTTGSPETLRQFAHP